MKLFVLIRDAEPKSLEKLILVTGLIGIGVWAGCSAYLIYWMFS